MDDGPMSTGLDPKTAGLLCYLLGFVTGLIFFLLEKENRFIRFHALQSILASVAVMVLFFIIDSLFVALFAGLHLFFMVTLLHFIGTLLGLAALALWIVLMVKAYQGEYFKLPVIGDLAEKNS